MVVDQQLADILNTVRQRQGQRHSARCTTINKDKKRQRIQGNKGDHLHEHGIAKDKEPKSLEHWSAVIGPLAFL